jgi:radical SAM superfamily enzyme YgiQ (UPF0313 family)
MSGFERIALVHIIATATHAANHGLAAIAASLVASGLSRESLTCHVLDTADLDDAPRSITQSGAEIVFVSFMSNQLGNVVTLTRALKRLNSKIKIVCGGHHITAVGYEAHLAHVDLQVPGEIDIEIGRIFSLFNYEATSGDRCVLNSLDDLPLPLVEIFSPEIWNRYPSVMFSRGCPYSCSYCMSRKGGVGGAIRWKSPERATDEIAQIVDYANPTEIYIDDDTLLKDPKWVLRFTQLYRRQFKLPYYCNARPETIKPKLVEALKESGCAGIGIGIESGSERIRQEILSRPMTDADIVKAFDVIRGFGLKSWSFNMIGIPTETVGDFLKTVELNDRCKVHYVRASIFTVFPGMIPPVGGLNTDWTSKSYFRTLNSLEPELRDRAEEWLRKLLSEKRLWLTDSELEQIGLKIQ